MVRWACAPCHSQLNGVCVCVRAPAHNGRQSPVCRRRRRAHQHRVRIHMSAAAVNTTRRCLRVCRALRMRMRRVACVSVVICALVYSHRRRHAIGVNDQWRAQIHVLAYECAHECVPMAATLFARVAVRAASPADEAAAACLRRSHESKARTQVSCNICPQNPRLTSKTTRALAARPRKHPSSDAQSTA